MRKIDMTTGGNRCRCTMVGWMRDVRGLQLESDEDFVSLYDRALPEVYSYLFSRLRDRSLAEDLTRTCSSTALVDPLAGSGSSCRG